MRSMGTLLTIAAKWMVGVLLAVLYWTIDTTLDEFVKPTFVNFLHSLRSNHSTTERPCYTFSMRFPEYNPPNLPAKESSESVAHEARREAIKTLQKSLQEDKTMSIKVRVARIQALIKLLEKEEAADHGEIVIPDTMHYAGPPKDATNESTAEPHMRAA